MSDALEHAAKRKSKDWPHGRKTAFVPVQLEMESALLR
jgi:hypothetical protein